MQRYSILFVLLAWTSVALGLDLSVESRSVIQGEAFALRVQVEDASQLGYLLFDVVYPSEALQLTGVTPGEVAVAMDEEGPGQAALFAMSPDRFPALGERLRFGWVFGPGYTGAGDLLTLQFQMGAAEIQEVPVRIEAPSAVHATENLEDEAVNTLDAMLEVLLYGDVNSDGVIGETDAQRVLQHVLGIVELAEPRLSLADVSGRYGVTPYDAALILMKASGKLAILPVLADSGASAALAGVLPVFSPAASPPLEIGRPRMEEGRVHLSLRVGRSDGIVSGGILIGYDTQRLRHTHIDAGTLTRDDLLWTRETSEGLWISFIRDTPLTGEGTLAELEFDLMAEPEAVQFALREVRFNEEPAHAQLGTTVQLAPRETRLLPNYPNPFNPDTWIPYQLARESDVSIQIYDALGRLVREFHLQRQRPGFYTSSAKAVHWDGRNAQGERVASGVYLYRLRAGDHHFIRKLVVLK